MRTALKSVLTEREVQDMQWGGHEHDDRQELHDWANYINKQLDKAIYQLAFPEVDVGVVRYQYVKAAALALAAIESIDRKYGGI